MKAISHQLTNSTYLERAKRPSVIKRFTEWCEGQQRNRLIWLALTVTFHGCVLTPVTLGIIMMFGNNFMFWPWTIAAMTMTVVVNLAAMPTKVTIPVFVLSVLIDFAIVISAIYAAL